MGTAAVRALAAGTAVRGFAAGGVGAFVGPDERGDTAIVAKESVKEARESELFLEEDPASAFVLSRI